MAEVSRVDDAAGRGHNTRGVRGLSDQIWQGQGGDAYRDFNLDLQKCLDELSGRAARTAETFLSYAQQLRYRQEDMASYRARANAGGLPVVGTVIHPAPVVARPEPPSGAAAESEKLDYWGRVSEDQSYLRSIDL